MGRNATAKLTSEERCRKAFAEWYLTPGVKPPEQIGQMGDHALLQFNAWQAAWEYLESRVTEFIHE